MRKRVALVKYRGPAITRSCEGGHDGLTDPVPAGSPLQTAQLIGSLVIRFVMFAESGMHWGQFPDKDLLDAILRNCKDPELAKEHLTALLFHHSKILDNCGTRGATLRQLAGEAFPRQAQKLIESPQWEIVDERTETRKTERLSS